MIRTMLLRGTGLVLSVLLVVLTCGCGGEPAGGGGDRAKDPSLKPPAGPPPGVAPTSAQNKP